MPNQYPIPSRCPLEQAEVLDQEQMGPLETMGPLRPQYDGAPALCTSLKKILGTSMYEESPKPPIGFLRQRVGASREMASLPIPIPGGERALTVPLEVFRVPLPTGGDGGLKLSDFQRTYIHCGHYVKFLAQGQVRSPGQVS